MSYKKGGIYHITDFEFRNETKNKFFVLISDPNKYIDYLLSLTTSWPEKAKKRPNSEYFKLCSTKYPFFNKDTVLEISNYHNLSKEILDNKNCQYKGDLDEEDLSKLYEMVQNSKIIPPHYKRYC